VLKICLGCQTAFGFCIFLFLGGKDILTEKFVLEEKYLLAKSKTNEKVVFPWCLIFFIS